MRIRNRRGHEHVGFVARVTKHQALIACTLFVIVRIVNALRDIWRLFTNCVYDGTGVTVESAIGVVVANIVNDAAHDIFDIDISLGCDFAGDEHHASFDERLAGDARARVFFEQRVKNGVGNLIGHLVGVSFGNRFGRE